MPRAYGLMVKPCISVGHEFLSFEFWGETRKLLHAGKLSCSQPQTPIMFDDVMKIMRHFQKRLNAPPGRPGGGGAGVAGARFQFEISSFGFRI